MAKVKMSIGEIFAQVFSDGRSETNVASVRIFSSTPGVCPLCKRKYKANTVHKCQKESK